MSKSKIISPKELSKYGLTKGLNEQVLALLQQQKANWGLVNNNYAALEKIQNKKFDFGHFKIIVQLNAERIRSSSAKTDAKSISERPCFLCLRNLPGEQKGIFVQDKYIILINPYPIFSEHIVINGLSHVDQQILPYFTDLLDLSENLPDFNVFYNGPKCGASAPDHFHFQAIGKGNLRVEQEFESLLNMHSEVLVQDKNVKIVAVDNYLRKFVVIISSEKKLVKEKFKQIYDLLDLKNGEEPMMNILSSFIGNEWRVIIFPREKQRPSHFFRDGEDNIVVGLATVEMGGILVLPREEDFNKITKTDIEEIYNEVTLNTLDFNRLKDALRTFK